MKAYGVCFLVSAALVLISWGGEGKGKALLSFLLIGGALREVWSYISNEEMYLFSYSIPGNQKKDAERMISFILHLSAIGLLLFVFM
ncbi:hypothetical protein ACEK07_07810 [Alcanivoracaceae bacterium MT1]